MTSRDPGDPGRLLSIDEPHFTVPLYQKAEAARLIRIPRRTLRDWTGNGGRLTLPSRGIAADDVLSRIRAGEPANEVAADYGLRLTEVTALLDLAA
jgi:hypothetical protein